VGLTTHINLTPKLMKEYVCTSNPFLGLRVLFWGELCHFSLIGYHYKFLYQNVLQFLILFCV